MAARLIIAGPIVAGEIFALARIVALRHRARARRQASGRPGGDHA